MGWGVDVGGKVTGVGVGSGVGNVMAVGVGWGVGVGGKVTGVGVGSGVGNVMAVGVGWGVDVGGKVTGVGVGSGVGNWIGVDVGIAVSAALMRSSARRSISSDDGPHPATVVIESARTTKIGNAPSVRILEAL